MAQEIPFLVSLTVGDECVTQKYCYRNLRRTLRLAAEMADGVPSGFVTIWWKSNRVAEVECDWKGRLYEASILSRRVTGQTLVTPLNVKGSIFKKPSTCNS